MGRGARGEGEGAYAQTARSRTAQPAAHAELAANGVVQCALGKAPRALLQQRGTREKRSLGNWAHLRRRYRRLARIHLVLFRRAYT